MVVYLRRVSGQPFRTSCHALAVDTRPIYLEGPVLSAFDPLRRRAQSKNKETSPNRMLGWFGHPFGVNAVEQTGEESTCGLRSPTKLMDLSEMSTMP